MKHTAALLSGALLLSLVPELFPQAKERPQDKQVQGFISDIQAREKSLKSMRLEMSTVGEYPNGVTFKTEGSLRVLGTTHIHVIVSSSFGEGVESEMETVVTPEGMWTRQKGPVEEIYTHMTAELMQKLKKATKALGRNDRAGLPGPLSGDGEAPLGSSMLVALDRQFELAVLPGKHLIDKVDCLVLEGKRRKGIEGADMGQSVKVLLRAGDHIPIRMTQFDDQGTLMLQLKIANLDLDGLVEKSSFKIDAPKNKVFIDVMDHQPSHAQIKRILDDYDAFLQEQEKKGDEGKTPKKEAGK